MATALGLYLREPRAACLQTVGRGETPGRHAPSAVALSAGRHPGRGDGLAGRTVSLFPLANESAPCGRGEMS